MKTQVDSGPNLLLDWNAQSYAPHWVSASAGSLLVHVLVVLFVTVMLNLPVPVPPPEQQIEQVTHRVTPLVAPRFHLTQKDPNQGKPNQELSVLNLTAQVAAKQTTQSSPALRKFEPPPSPALPAPPRFNEPPSAVQALNTAPALIPQAGVINVPPPKLQTEEPKLAFETPGQGGSAPIAGKPRIAPPKTTVDDAIKNVARGSKGNGTVREMEPAPDLPDSMRAPQVSGASKIMPELLSDPQGVDFKPYIIQVLTLVRRNWMAIIPESVHYGRRGVVTLQFIVDRDGLVPKLVIASSSGADALDRAAVAGVSASQRFPPFPPGFQGKEVRLQFSFKYNMQ